MICFDTESISTKSKIFYQGLTLSAGYCLANKSTVNAAIPIKLFKHGFEQLSQSSYLEEAVAEGAIVSSILLLSGIVNSNKTVSVAYASFLVVLCQTFLFSGYTGQQIILARNLVFVQLDVSLVSKVHFETMFKIERKKRGLLRPKLKTLFQNFLP